MYGGEGVGGVEWSGDIQIWEGGGGDAKCEAGSGIFRIWREDRGEIQGVEEMNNYECRRMRSASPQVPSSVVQLNTG